MGLGPSQTFAFVTSPIKETKRIVHPGLDTNGYLFIL